MISSAGHRALTEVDGLRDDLAHEEEAPDDVEVLKLEAPRGLREELHLLRFSGRRA